MKYKVVVGYSGVVSAPLGSIVEITDKKFPMICYKQDILNL